MNQDKTRLQFLALLRAGLWGTQVDNGLFDGGTDWKEIYRLGIRQAVVGIIGDGIGLLPASLRPKRATLLQWQARLIEIERTNSRMNSFIPWFTTLLKEHGVRFWIIKGQGLAQSYPQPLHRQSGDIDVLVTKTDYKKAKDLLNSLSPVDKSPLSALHCAANIDGIEVELHGELNSIINRQVDRHFNEWLKKELCDSPLTTYAEDGKDIPVPSPDFNAVYVFIHFFRHLLESGIGFRQVCDWMRVLYVYRDDIDRCKLKKTLTDFRLMQAWQRFGCLAVNLLGMSEQAMPFFDKKYENSSTRLAERIFENGNFGKNNKHLTNVPDNFLLRKCHSFYYRTLYKLKNLSLFPRETVYSILVEWKNATIKLSHGR